MSAKQEESSLHYAEKAFIAFHEIRSSSQKDMMENINRVNKGELFVLHFLVMHNRAALPSELSAALQSSTARISALLGVLEKKGQIVRDVDKNNRRNILVTITESGRSRVKKEMREMKHRMIQVFTDMGEADTAEFIRLTRRFSQLMQKHMSPAPKDTPETQDE